MSAATSPSGSSDQGLRYRDAGVDIDAAERALDQSKAAIRATFGPRVLADVGSFGGLFRADGLGEEPVLVATADGVGTKVRIASAVGRFDTVGWDLVNHCINDALVQGARPLFFLDYIGVGRLVPEQVAALLQGLAAACKSHGVTLLGGETAEMPGVYPAGEFDLVGTLVGVVERRHILDGSRVQAGDRLLGLASNGLHTNGYSLARRIVEERMGLSYDDLFPGLSDQTVAEVLLEPHRCYLPLLQELLTHPGLHALAHITGGGVPGNLPRVLPGHGAEVSRTAVPELPVFSTLVEAGAVAKDEAWRAFNMGVGMILVVDSASEDEIRGRLEAAGEAVFALGQVTRTPGVQWLDASA
ncbi:MAG: phosphoribosylformylglycinamidine cyclo-ligase [Planctomycetota bacterium]|nr:MAG: phosphoribosylformylglycinamidine cyclo-ligase [Planctomycetota bacterium]